MTSEYDRGPIIDVVPCNLNAASSYVEIRTQVYKHSCMVAVNSIRKVLDRSVSFSDLPPQDEANARYWPPMPLDLELEVINKANCGMYKPGAINL